MDRQHDVLSFQRLDVYQCAVEFLAISIDVSTRLPKGYAALADQLRRSALSVPLNIASARASPRSPGSHRRNAHQALLTTVAVAVAVAVNVNVTTRPLSYRSLSPSVIGIGARSARRSRPSRRAP